MTNPDDETDGCVVGCIESRNDFYLKFIHGMEGRNYFCAKTRSEDVFESKHASSEGRRVTVLGQFETLPHLALLF